MATALVTSPTVTGLLLGVFLLKADPETVAFEGFTKEVSGFSDETFREIALLSYEISPNMAKIFIIILQI